MTLSHDEIMRVLFAARPRLGAAAFVIARDAQAAEDIFQNVALKALTKDATFEHEGALLSWATVSARREALDWLRRRKPEVPVLDHDVLDLLEAEGTAAPADTGRVGALRDCLEKIPVDSRRLLELRYFEGRSCTEVAAAVGAGLDAVYQRLSRLHRQLRACVEQRLGGAHTEAT
ncbi:MAG: sigma-70 family RNA polymerase sigma factor [Kiritimatiellaeota bacterium]|nr:sigma-70 family RNA polymerase sigma factor [Kiritimatiellota bacterium]